MSKNDLREPTTEQDHREVAEAVADWKASHPEASDEEAAGWGKKLWQMADALNDGRIRDWTEEELAAERGEVWPPEDGDADDDDDAEFDGYLPQPSIN